MKYSKRLKEYRQRNEELYSEQQFILADSGCYFHDLSEYKDFSDIEDEQ